MNQYLNGLNFEFCLTIAAMIFLEPPILHREFRCFLIEDIYEYMVQTTAARSIEYYHFTMRST